MKKHNPDDRRDNVKKIQKNIDRTIRNMELAEDMMAITDNNKTKEQMEEKNDRREKALEGMRHEIKDEAKARKNDYK
ncbi:MAG: tlp [Clostridia bacterium]|jgi:small acid-soluble spore protein (thioredoxin-like protein)|nr:tlp [Clostridia bacterium]